LLVEDLVASLSDASVEFLLPTDAETACFLQHRVPGATGGECEQA
jgi:hypothetical protein